MNEFDDRDDDSENESDVEYSVKVNSTLVFNFEDF